MNTSVVITTVIIESHFLKILLNAPFLHLKHMHTHTRTRAHTNTHVRTHTQDAVKPVLGSAFGIKNGKILLPET